MTTLATVTRIHAHTCPYLLRVGDRWVSASSCCWGQTVQAEAPAPKRRTA